MKNFTTFTVEVHGDAQLIIRQVENKCETAAAPIGQPQLPDIRLKLKKGMRINFIRVVYTLWKLGFFVDSLGRELAATEVFQAFGRLLGIDLTDYHNDMNSSLQAGKSEEKHLDIFRRMLNVMKEKYYRS